ncbi:MAG: N-acetylglucosamine kinase [Chitinophagaceae bacterium]|nr:N-acetylglucosamine kinase [Chitinophagaceae bacterium]
MATVKLIADSGATKADWCLLTDGRKKTISTQGISPYFLNTDQITELLRKELVPLLGKHSVEEIYYYGTGCANPANARSVKKALRNIFPSAYSEVTHDLMAAARALLGNEKGIACILGTGSNSCYYNGKKIVRNSPGLGYVLGDEGSGAYLGKKVLQYYLYGTFDDELRGRFDLTYTTNTSEILENVYKKPLPNRYLAGFARFLAENRGHYMIENIIEDGLNDFFFSHLCKYRETWTLPVSFTGGVAYGFGDVVKQLCNSYEFELGRILKTPMDGLIAYHR